MKLFIAISCFFFWGCEFNKDTSSNDLFLINNQPKKISIQGFHMDDPQISGINTGIESDTFPPIEIFNIRTGKILDLDVPFHLYFNDRKIEIKNHWFPDEVLPNIADTNNVIIKLEVADFLFVGNVPAYSFEDFVQLKFHMNFDSKIKKCNESYFANSVMETFYKRSYIRSDESDTTVICNSTTLQILEVGRLYGGSADIGSFELYETYDGLYSKFNGTYNAKINDTTLVSFELIDSAKFILTFSNGEKILRKEHGGWYYMSDDNTIRFNLSKPILLQQGEQVIKFKNSVLETKKNNSPDLIFSTYQFKDDKIIKSNLLELIKEDG